MKCWAEKLGDCDGKQSREHYISQCVFDDNVITAIGMDWCKEPKQIGLGQAVAKILCEKHNSYLSDFDAEAKKLSKYLLEQMREKPNENGALNLNGWNLEKWALKTAINLSNLGTFGEKTSAPTMEHLHYIYRNDDIPDGMGLYLINGELDTRYAKAGVLWVDIRNTITSELVAVKLTLNGVQFLVCLVAERADKKNFSDGIHSSKNFSYRPNQISIEGKINTNKKSTITLDWNLNSIK
jgi:hypothetical protein